MYLLFVFGREVERFLGRRTFIGLYANFVAYTGDAPDDLGPMGTVRDYWFGRSCTLEYLLRLRRFTRVSKCCCGSMAKWIALILAAIYTSSTAGLSRLE